jgi:hypothetical protein
MIFQIMDFKEDYSFMIKYLKNCIAVRPDNSAELLFNPLLPPLNKSSGEFLINYKIWANVFCEIFCQAFGLLTGSKFMLIQYLLELYRLANEKGFIPNIPDLLRFIENKGCPKRQTWANFWQRIVNRLRALDDLFADAFECQRGFLPDLTEMSVIWRMSRLSGEFQVFLTTFICSYFMNYFIEIGNRGKLQMLIILDDATKLMDVALDFRYEVGLVTQQKLFKTVREFGIGLILADQSIRDLSRVVPANTFTKIAFCVVSGEDALILGKHLSLDEPQMDSLKSLPVGTAVVKMADRWTEPFLVRTNK